MTFNDNNKKFWKAVKFLKQTGSKLIPRRPMQRSKTHAINLLQANLTWGGSPCHHCLGYIIMTYDYCRVIHVPSIRHIYIYIHILSVRA